MNLRIENIEMQNNNMINSTGDQLLMLSFDMFNNGIKTYNLGKKLTKNFDKYFEQIKNISNQINNLINSYYLEKQLKMAQQQMMKQQMAQPKINDWKTVVAGFKDHTGLTSFKIETEKTLKELFDEYMEKIYGYNNSKIAFIYNAKRIDRNSNKKIKDYFSNCKGNPSLPSIMVI